MNVGLEYFRTRFGNHRSMGCASPRGRQSFSVGSPHKDKNVYRNVLDLKLWWVKLGIQLTYWTGSTSFIVDALNLCANRPLVCFAQDQRTVRACGLVLCAVMIAGHASLNFCNSVQTACGTYIPIAIFWPLEIRTWKWTWSLLFPILKFD